MSAVIVFRVGNKEYRSGEEVDANALAGDALIIAMRFPPLILLSFPLVMFSGPLACQQVPTAQREAPADTNSGNLSAAEREAIRASLVPHPLPDAPDYIKVRQGCLFFAKHPGDGSMVPVGMVQTDAYLIMRNRDGAWVDVQLTSGQLGSVLASNVKALTPEESASEAYLDPQPDLQPLTLPQASATEATGINPVLLGG